MACWKLASIRRTAHVDEFFETWDSTLTSMASFFSASMSPLSIRLRIFSIITSRDLPATNTLFSFHQQWYKNAICCWFLSLFPFWEASYPICGSAGRSYGGWLTHIAFLYFSIRMWYITLSLNQYALFLE